MAGVGDPARGDRRVELSSAISRGSACVVDLPCDLVARANWSVQGMKLGDPVCLGTSNQPAELQKGVTRDLNDLELVFNNEPITDYRAAKGAFVEEVLLSTAARSMPNALDRI